MPFDANTVKQLCREVYKRQRYLVIGQPVNALAALEIGDTTSFFCQFNLNAEFSVDEVATQEDYNRQSDLIAELRPDWVRVPSQAGVRFFKIRAIPKL